MFDGILFDLDGTLWDATPVIQDAWQQVLDSHPQVSRPPITVPEVRSTMGMLLPDIARTLFPNEEESLRTALNTEHSQVMYQLLAQRGGVLYPQVEETLARLAGEAKLFLVSNCGDGYFDAFYAAHDLKRYFTADLCAGRTGKPKSENIAQIVRDFSLCRPVYVGDTAIDHAAAQAAGVAFLHAAYGFGAVPGVPAAPSFAAIPAALAAMCPP